MFDENFIFWLKEAGLLQKKKVLSDTMHPDIRTYINCMLQDNRIFSMFDYGLSTDSYSDFTNTYQYSGCIKRLEVWFTITFEQSHWHIIFKLNHSKFKKSVIYSHNIFVNDVTYGNIYEYILNTLEEIRTLYILHTNKLYVWKLFNDALYEEFKNDEHLW